MLAQALARASVWKGAWVVRGVDGLDEVSPCAPTRVSAVGADGVVREMVVSPEDAGVERLAPSAIAGSDAAANAQALTDILGGRPHPAREAVVLNAAAALHVATGATLRECAERARRTLESGAGRDTLERWKRTAIQAKAP